MEMPSPENNKKMGSQYLFHYLKLQPSEHG